MDKKTQGKVGERDQSQQEKDKELLQKLHQTEITYWINTINDHVAINFSQPIQALVINKSAAFKLAQNILKKARELPPTKVNGS